MKDEYLKNIRAILTLLRSIYKTMLYLFNIDANLTIFAIPFRRIIVIRAIVIHRTIVAIHTS